MVYNRVLLKPYVENNRSCILEENDGEGEEKDIESDETMDEENRDNSVKNGYGCDEKSPVVPKYWDMVSDK